MHRVLRRRSSTPTQTPEKIYHRGEGADFERREGESFGSRLYAEQIQLRELSNSRMAEQHEMGVYS